MELGNIITKLFLIRKQTHVPHFSYKQKHALPEPTLLALLSYSLYFFP